MKADVNKKHFQQLSESNDAVSRMDGLW